MTDADRKRLNWTLFQRLDAADPTETSFRAALDRFFDAEADGRTLELLNSA
jgi:uncharacterized protein (DUF1810 family)